jgi:histone acetyltransferase (RNA polymerase elongator complex component)
LIVPFFIPHAGCPHHCVFCNQLDITGSGAEMPTTGGMLDTISSFGATARDGVTEVAFYGGSFTALPHEIQRQLLEPIQPLIATGQVASVRVSTRPDAVDRETTAFLREMGVKTVELGVQSLDDEVLSLSGRGHDAACVAGAIHVLREEGLLVGVQLMPGLPGDTPGRSLMSLRTILQLKPDFLRIYPALVIEGTELARLYRAGSYRPLSLAEAVELCKRMLHLAMRAAVPVLRIGLQPNDSLMKAGVILAGPFHPAFRNLVDAELCLDLLLSLAEGFPRGSIVTVCCAPSRTGDVAGQKRTNIAGIEERLGVRVGRIQADSRLSEAELVVRSESIMKKGSLLSDAFCLPEGRINV